MPRRPLTSIVLAMSLACTASSVLAQANPYQKGPNPTLASVQADGPFAVSTQTVSGSGFGGGTVYTPTAPGQYGLVAVCPGFVSARSAIADVSRRLATHGFVVVAISTITPFDLPGSRGNQLLAALRATQELQTGPVLGKIDTTRLAVAGWSMGGGGTIRVVESTPTLKAGTAWAPWALWSDLKGNNTVPLAITGGSADVVAAPGSFASKFYASMPTTTRKLLGVIRDADHGFPTTTSEPNAYTTVAWMKRFVDDDTRYSAFLNGDTRFSEFRSTGPF